MTQTSNRFYDQFARLMNDAAGVASGVRREAETLFRGQADRFINGMDLVRREEFDVVREMVVKAREDNARLEARIAELEARLAGATPAAAELSSGDGPSVAVPKPRTRRPKTGAGEGPGTETDGGL